MRIWEVQHVQALGLLPQFQKKLEHVEGFGGGVSKSGYPDTPFTQRCPQNMLCLMFWRRGCPSPGRRPLCTDVLVFKTS
jgi:hypothetical protein